MRLIWDPHRNIIGSMLQDCKRGLKCEVEALNGYLSKMAKSAGVATPVNDQVTDPMPYLPPLNGQTTPKP